MHEKNIALLCDEADRLLQLNINLLRQMVDEPDVLSDSKNENRLLFDKQKALKRIEELEGEQIKTARREMVLAVVGTMKAGKSTTINAIVGQEILPNRNRPMTSVPTLIRHVPGKTEPVLHLEHIQPVRNLLSTLQQKLDTPAGQQVAQTLQQTGDTCELLDILANDGWLKNEYHGEEEIFTGLASLNDLVRLNQLLDILRHKALTQMAQESGGSATVRLNTLDWLGGQSREQADNEWHEAINWLGDWCSEERHPVIWSTTQAAEYLPVRMPRLCSAERLSESMVDEIFQKGAA